MTLSDEVLKKLNSQLAPKLTYGAVEISVMRPEQTPDTTQIYSHTYLYDYSVRVGNITIESRI